MEYLVEMRQISKQFPGVRALRDVDFSIREGEIVCLLGENGAGKSTLMKILTGVYKQDCGTIYYRGQELVLNNPKDAYERGINIIFQEFNLCPNLSAMENLFLGNENRTKRGLFSYTKTRKRAQQLFEMLDIDIDCDAKVSQLNVARQQMVEIAKALAYDTKLLIMDEPTSALTDKEITTLLAIMRTLKRRGVAIIFISHKLEEVLQISDRIVVLRDGENCGDVETAQATKNHLVSLMVGRAVTNGSAKRTTIPSQETLLEAEGICGGRIQDASFSIKKGEILGFAGLVGSGRSALARLIIGAEKRSAGTITLNGSSVVIRHPKDSIAAGIAYLPDDRKNMGLVLPMTVRENTTMCIHEKIRRLLGIISSKEEHLVVNRYIDELDIRVYSSEQKVSTLSGGNQQKIVIAKSLAVTPKLLILCEPTRGIDVGAKAEVHNIIFQLADQGISIIVISSELQEIFNLSDRIIVMHEGVITANLPRHEATQEVVMRAAIGTAS
ncbi:MAG: sugar ABC transporter ATP-binding protein [Sphaerochaeta sp.]|nr:sugar ABC transporter ATP-binding protein [Sphaerochaeta sp.]MDX9914500.1 sugar ABC transporter ATP-binding protein [Sphaerochaeta sp.]